MMLKILGKQYMHYKHFQALISGFQFVAGYNSQSGLKMWGEDGYALEYSVTHKSKRLTHHTNG